MASPLFFGPAGGLFLGPWLALLASAVFALASGFRLERTAGALVLITCAAIGAAALAPVPWRGWMMMGVDVALLVALLGLAVACKPLWPLFAAAFQLLTVATRSLWLNVETAGWPLQLPLQAWSYALAAALALAAWRARRARRSKDSREPVL